MNKVDYNAKMKEQIQSFSGKPKLLLHSCCAPCSSSVLERIEQYFDVTVLYYNPNIHPKEEYIKRKQEQIRLLEELNIKFLDCEYGDNDYFRAVCGLEGGLEGGARCEKCFRLRLEYTAKTAKENGFDIFGTTLTVSPHKNAVLINSIGEELSKKYGINFLYSDFKKEDGYLKSITLSKQYGLYRQNYCGCKFSQTNN